MLQAGYRVYHCVQSLKKATQNIHRVFVHCKVNVEYREFQYVRIRVHLQCYRWSAITFCISSVTCTLHYTQCRMWSLHKMYHRMVVFE